MYQKIAGEFQGNPSGLRGYQMVSRTFQGSSEVLQKVLGALQGSHGFRNVSGDSMGSQDGSCI